MYDFFKKNEDEFNRRYHQRSNVETTFFMLKTRFGSNLSTKNFEANIVEMKMKVLCHNLCVLVQEAFENGVNLDIMECVKMERTV